VGFRPEVNYFKPAGIPLSGLEEINLAVDELEAIRLSDFLGLYQEEAAKKMNVSRQTFGNIINSAHKKVAEALLNAKAIKIEGGTVKMTERHFACYDCKHEWSLPYGSGRPQECLSCKSLNIHRAAQQRGWARGSRGTGLGRGRCGRSI